VQAIFFLPSFFGSFFLRKKKNLVALRQKKNRPNGLRPKKIVFHSTAARFAFFFCGRKTQSRTPLHEKNFLRLSFDRPISALFFTPLRLALGFFL